MSFLQKLSSFMTPYWHGANANQKTPSPIYEKYPSFSMPSDELSRQRNEKISHVLPRYHLTSARLKLNPQGTLTFSYPSPEGRIISQSFKDENKLQNWLENNEKQVQIWEIVDSRNDHPVLFYKLRKLTSPDTLMEFNSEQSLFTAIMQKNEGGNLIRLECTHVDWQKKNVNHQTIHLLGKKSSWSQDLNIAAKNLEDLEYIVPYEVVDKYYKRMPQLLAAGITPEMLARSGLDLDQFFQDSYVESSQQKKSLKDLIAIGGIFLSSGLINLVNNVSGLSKKFIGSNNFTPSVFNHELCFTNHIPPQYSPVLNNHPQSLVRYRNAVTPLSMKDSWVSVITKIASCFTSSFIRVPETASKIHKYTCLASLLMESFPKVQSQNIIAKNYNFSINVGAGESIAINFLENFVSDGFIEFDASSLPTFLTINRLPTLINGIFNTGVPVRHTAQSGSTVVVGGPNNVTQFSTSTSPPSLISGTQHGVAYYNRVAIGTYTDATFGTPPNIIASLGESGEFGWQVFPILNPSLFTTTPPQDGGVKGILTDQINSKAVISDGRYIHKVQMTGPTTFTLDSLNPTNININQISFCENSNNIVCLVDETNQFAIIDLFNTTTPLQYTYPLGNPTVDLSCSSNMCFTAGLNWIRASNVTAGSPPSWTGTFTSTGNETFSALTSSNDFLLFISRGDLPIVNIYDARQPNNITLYSSVNLNNGTPNSVTIGTNNTIFIATSNGVVEVQLNADSITGTAPQEGDYSFNLTGTALDGSKATALYNLHIIPSPTAAFPISNPNSIPDTPTTTPQDASSLSDGEKAGIGVGVGAFAILVGLGIYLIYTKVIKKQTNQTQDVEAGVQNEKRFERSHEIVQTTYLFGEIYAALVWNAERLRDCFNRTGIMANKDDILGKIGQGQYGVVEICWCTETQDYMVRKTIENEYQGIPGQNNPDVEAELQREAFKASGGIGGGIADISGKIYDPFKKCSVFISRVAHFQDLKKLSHIIDSTKNNQKRILFATWIARETLKGLAVLVKLGIYHNDLKLENVFPDKDGNIGIGDFGSAVKSSNKTIETGFSDFLHKSPEELKEKLRYANKSDGWAVGILLLEFLYNQSLFELMSVIFKDNIEGLLFKNNSQQLSQDPLRLVLINTMMGILYAEINERPPANPKTGLKQFGAMDIIYAALAIINSKELSDEIRLESIHFIRQLFETLPDSIPELQNPETDSLWYVIKNLLVVNPIKRWKIEKALEAECFQDLNKEDFKTLFDELFSAMQKNHELNFDTKPLENNNQSEKPSFYGKTDGTVTTKVQPSHYGFIPSTPEGTRNSPVSNSNNNTNRSNNSSISFYK